jgi:hypothetical protein
MDSNSYTLAHIAEVILKKIVKEVRTNIFYLDPPNVDDHK